MADLSEWPTGWVPSDEVSATGQPLIERPCGICGQRDTHPRHTTQISRVISTFHIDCHAAAGCGQCARDVVKANGKQGDELRVHLIQTREAAENG